MLGREREPSMYGDEEAGIPPEELYSRFDAENALRMCTTVKELAEKLLDTD